MQVSPVPGYRDLTAAELAEITDLKDTEAFLAGLCSRLEEVAGEDAAAQRWATLARHHLEIGMMMAIKSVAKPTISVGRVAPQRQAII